MKWNLPDCRLRWFLSCKVLLKALIAIKIFIQDRPVPIGRSSRTTDHRPEVGNAFLHDSISDCKNALCSPPCRNQRRFNFCHCCWHSCSFGDRSQRKHTASISLWKDLVACVKKTHSSALMNELNAHHFFFTQNPPPFMVIRLQS